MLSSFPRSSVTLLAIVIVSFISSFDIVNAGHNDTTTTTNSTTTLLPPFQSLFILGDGHSDSGSTSHLHPDLSLPFTQPAYYTTGRSTNGPVYAEYLAKKLVNRLNDDIFLASFAFENATIDNLLVKGTVSLSSNDGSDNTQVVTVPDFNDQARGVPVAIAKMDGDADLNYLEMLLVSWIGTQEYQLRLDQLLASEPGVKLNQSAIMESVNTTVTSLLNTLDKLYLDGVRNFMIMSIPSDFIPPAFASSNTSSLLYKKITKRHNTLVAEYVSSKSNSEGNEAWYIHIDTNELLTTIIDSSNATLDSTTPCTVATKDSTEPDCENFVFLDTHGHFTTNIHKLLAGELVRVLKSEWERC